jgi:hypothetical protein
VLQRILEGTIFSLPFASSQDDLPRSHRGVFINTPLGRTRLIASGPLSPVSIPENLPMHY